METFHNIWQKVRNSWIIIGIHLIDNFDYYFICGDDTYVIIDNLRKYLSSQDQTIPSYYGQVSYFFGLIVTYIL